MCNAAGYRSTGNRRPADPSVIDAVTDSIDSDAACWWSIPVRRLSTPHPGFPRLVFRALASFPPAHLAVITQDVHGTNPRLHGGAPWIGMPIATPGSCPN